MDTFTIESALARQRAERPDSPALLCGERTETFGELDRHSSQLANRLLATGTPAGRIAYLGKNSHYWVHAFCGAAKAGWALVGINWRLAAAEVEYILADSGSEVLLVTPAFAAVAETLRGTLPSLREVIVCGGDAGETTDYEDWLAGADATLTGGVVDGDPVVCQVYTSGTTGRPKGALLTRSNLAESVRLTRAASDYLTVTADQVYLANTPQFHIAGPLGAMSALDGGARSVILTDFNPAEYLDLVGRYPIKTLWLVPAMLQALLDHPAAAGTDFSHVEYVAYGSAPMPPALLQRAIERIGCRFAQSYGLTEHTGPATLLRPEDHDPAGNEQMLSVGRALPGVELRVVNEKGEAVPTGEIGEVVLRSPAVMQGYWNQPAATAESLRDGWLHTGDAAVLDADGYVYLKDRIKDMLVSGGENVYPMEVEQALAGHPSVAEVSVVGIPDERWGEVGKAFVVLRPGAELDAESLSAWAGERIARFKLPKEFEAIDALPRNASGKVLRRELRGE